MLNWHRERLSKQTDIFVCSQSQGELVKGKGMESGSVWSPHISRHLVQDNFENIFKEELDETQEKSF